MTTVERAAVVEPVLIGIVVARDAQDAEEIARVVERACVELRVQTCGEHDGGECERKAQGATTKLIADDERHADGERERLHVVAHVTVSDKGQQDRERTDADGQDEIERACALQLRLCYFILPCRFSLLRRRASFVCAREKQTGEDDGERVFDNRVEDSGREERVEEAAERAAGGEPEIELCEMRSVRSVSSEQRVTGERSEKEVEQVQAEDEREGLRCAGEIDEHKQERHAGHDEGEQARREDLPTREGEDEREQVERERDDPEQRQRSYVG